MNLAKIRHRVMAALLDNAIIYVFIGVALLGAWVDLLYALINDVQLDIFIISKIIRSGIFCALVLLFYYMVIPILFKGQTIGKWVFKIKIVTDGGEDVDYKILFFREAICRILIRTISIGLSSVVSYLIMLIRDDKKSLADVFAKTKVIDIKGA